MLTYKHPVFFQFQKDIHKQRLYSLRRKEDAQLYCCHHIMSLKYIIKLLTSTDRGVFNLKQLSHRDLRRVAQSYVELRSGYATVRCHMLYLRKSTQVYASLRKSTPRNAKWVRKKLNMFNFFGVLSAQSQSTQVYATLRNCTPLLRNCTPFLRNCTPKF